MQRKCSHSPGKRSTTTHTAVVQTTTLPKHGCCAVGTLYEVLGVSTKATAVEVKAAYRRKVLVHHPDVQQQVGVHAKRRCPHSTQQQTSNLTCRVSSALVYRVWVRSPCVKVTERCPC
jgi:hypothetical protein